MEFAALSSPLRVAVINCEDAEKWSDHVQVLQTAYGRAGDEWVEYEARRRRHDLCSRRSRVHRYRAWLNEFPDDAALARLDAVVCPGSRHSATDDSLPWLASLLETLRRVAYQSSVQLLCICFGHQALARALGGDVSKNPAGAGFRYVAETIRCAPGWRRALTGEDGEDAEEEEEEIVLLESHGDCVCGLPPKAICLASSPGAAHEIVVVGSTVLSYQSHPEFTSDPASSR